MLSTSFPSILQQRRPVSAPQRLVSRFVLSEEDAKRIPSFIPKPPEKSPIKPFRERIQRINLSPEGTSLEGGSCVSVRPPLFREKTEEGIEERMSPCNRSFVLPDEEESEKIHVPARIRTSTMSGSKVFSCEGSSSDDEEVDSKVFLIKS